MAYTGNKPTNVVDVSETQALTVDGDLTVDTDTLKADSANNRVGVGVASPDTFLHVQDVAASTSTHSYTKVHIEDSDHLALQFSGGTGGETWIWFADDTTSTPVGGITYYHGGPYMAFRVESAERMRIDSSGRLLVGKTTNAIGTAGCNVQGDGFLSATRSGAQCAGFNRLSDDGNITEFRQDGTLIGAIGSSGSDLYIASGSGAGLLLDGSNVLPTNGSGVAVDDDRDLGSSSHRWRDIFTNGAVTTTSDQNKKQQIATLTSAEIAAAKRISALFKTFKFNNAVTKKGDSARIHAGVIAQEVYTALEAEGLDATKYAFWCSDTWWEKDVEVAAVKAKDAVTRKYTDADGTEVEEVITPAIEASDAYTRTDIYNTKDEAPEGATETTRLSVRYAELMAFVGAATEQRLTDIETRLAALEG